MGTNDIFYRYTFVRVVAKSECNSPCKDLLKGWMYFPNCHHIFIMFCYIFLQSKLFKCHFKNSPGSVEITNKHRYTNVLLGLIDQEKDYYIIMFYLIIRYVSDKMEKFSHPFAGSNTEPGKVAVAFYAGIFSYSGWLVFWCIGFRILGESCPSAIM